MNDFKYTFVLGGRAITCTHDEYLKNWELRAMVNPEGMSDDMKREFPQIIARGYYRLFLGRTIFCIPLDVLADDKDTHKELEFLRFDQQRNPLKYYAPNNHEQLDFINDDDGTVFAEIEPNRTGKALSLETTTVVTPSGNVPLEQIKVGDSVIASDGRPHKVTGVYDQGLRPTYRLHFDGSDHIVDADEDHLWYYMSHWRATKHDGIHDRWSVVKTKDIIKQQGLESTAQTRGYIPLTRPVEMENNEEAFLDPYVLGVILGDGNITEPCGVRIASSDDHIIRKVAQRIFSHSQIKKIGNSKYDYMITGLGDRVRINGERPRINVVLNELRKYGLQGLGSHEKFIPDCYKSGSSMFRLELLRGLLDTDGSCCKNSHIEFAVSSKKLADDVCWLVWSLGGKTQMTDGPSSYKDKHGNRIECKRRYRVSIRLDYACPFTLKRKAARWRASMLRPGRLVYSIEPIGMKHCRCLTVDSPDSSFLVNDFIVTHNTTSSYVKLMVMDPPMFPLDPTWPIFVDHGVKWREWKGPISVGVATYNVAKLGDPIWKEMIRKWTPDSELGVYGRTYKGKGAKYGPSMNHEKLIRLHSGSDIGFYTYEMDQGNYEGTQLKRWLWDEQGEKAKWDGADRGTRTTAGKHIFSLTPHKVEGRPDTGGSGWLREFLDGVDTMGHTVKKYGSKTINDVPDWIYPERSKAIEFEKWCYGPKRTGNRKMIAEGRARLFAEWHFSEGLVFDEWYPEVHWIDPLWEKPPEDYTLYRAIDHGMKDPTVCLWFAVAPDGTIYLYRCYYQINKTIYENVENIIAMSGNERKKLSVARISDNFHLDSFEEVMVGEGICKTILDSRSFSAPDGSSGKPMGWIYKQAGFQNSRLAQASGKSRHTWVPMINQLLHVDDDLVSPVTRRPPGARMYWFNTCVAARREIEQYVYQENTDRPIDKNDHVATALAYAVQIPLRYAGGQNMWRMPKAQERVMAGGNFWDDPLDKKGKKVPDYGYRPIGG